MKIEPYLSFAGTCEEAMRFYEKTLGGRIEAMMRFADTPAADYAPGGQKDLIMHARLVIGDNVIMASDEPAEMHRTPQGFHLSINVDSVDDAERIYRTLAEGGAETMPLDKTFWADRFGMLVDRYGTHWMVNYGGDAAKEGADVSNETATSRN